LTKAYEEILDFSLEWDKERRETEETLEEINERIKSLIKKLDFYKKLNLKYRGRILTSQSKLLEMSKELNSLLELRIRKIKPYINYWT